MHGQTVSCPKCRTPLPEFLFNQGEPAPCPACDARVQVEVFPALFKQIAEGKAGETILVEGEASCFYHPQKRASLPCAACGRFLCALCDVELNGEHLCPTCLETGRKKGKLAQLETKRVLYDSTALLLAVFPLVIFCAWWASLVTAPAAIILAVYSWYQPPSILPRTRLRSWLAILFGLIQITAWILLFTGVLKSLNWFN